jgi:hypothetical protein
MLMAPWRQAWSRWVLEEKRELAGEDAQRSVFNTEGKGARHGGWGRQVRRHFCSGGSMRTCYYLNEAFSRGHSASF